jgi:hypothetical protein
VVDRHWSAKLRPYEDELRRLNSQREQRPRNGTFSVGNRSQTHSTPRITGKRPPIKSSESYHPPSQYFGILSLYASSANAGQSIFGDLASTSSASVKFTVGSFPSSLSHACRQTTPSSLGLIPATRLKPANELHPKREFVRVVY